LLRSDLNIAKSTVQGSEAEWKGERNSKRVLGEIGNREGKNSKEGDLRTAISGWPLEL